MEDGKLWKYKNDGLDNEFSNVRKTIDSPLISPPNGHDHEEKTQESKYTYKYEIKTSLGEDSKKVINPLKICIGKRLRTPDDDIDDYYCEIKKRSIAQNDNKICEPHPVNKTLCNPSHLKKMKAAKQFQTEINETITVSKNHFPPFKKGQLKGSQMNEYAEYLGLQPTVKFKCRKCCSMSFKSLAVLKEHQRVCRGQKETIGPPPEASTSGRMTRKVYLCSACGTYYENWNLFLHMREVHNRHICLFCLGMFSRAEKLAGHLSSKHNVVETHYHSATQFLEKTSGPLYLMCCSCDTVYTEKDDFSLHECKKKEPKTQVKNISKPVTQTNVSENIATSAMEQEKEITSSHSKDVNTKPDTFSLETNTVVEQNSVIETPQQESKKEIYDKNENIKDESTSTIENVPPHNNSTSFQNKDSSNNSLSSPLTLQDVGEFNKMSVANESTENEHLLSYKNDITESENEIESMREPNTIKADDSLLFKSPSSPKTSVTQSPLLTSLLMKSPSHIKFDKPSINTTEYSKIKPSQYDETCQISNNNITVEKSKEPGLKLKFNLHNVSSPIIVNSSVNKVPLTIAKPPNRTRRPPKRFDDFPPTPTVTSPAPPVSSLKTTIYDIHPTQNDNLNRVPKLTVRVPREILEKQFSSDSSESEDENRLTMDISETKNEEITSIEPKNLESAVNEKEENNVEDIPKEISDQSAEVNHQIPPDINEPLVEIEKEEPVEPKIEAPLSELRLDKPLDKYPLKDLLKICVNATMWNCIYCNHVRKIAVNCKKLGQHILENHRFSATVDSITAEELLPETINTKIKTDLDEVEAVSINLGTFDSVEKSDVDDFDHIFECFQCYFKTSVHKELYFHNRKLHQKAILLCVMCKSNFYSYSELLSHLCPGDYSPEIDLKFRCCFCQTNNIPSTFRLMVHLRKVHHTCDVCLENCGNQTKLSMHVWKHKLHHLCYRCGIAYRNKPDITKHLFWKHGTESIICKKCMQKKWPHIYHFCIPPISFICEECKLSFSTAVSLKVHKRFHSGEFPHACTETDCVEKFVSRKLLDKHQEKHKPLEIDLTLNDDVVNEAKNELKAENSEEKPINPETKLEISGSEGVLPNAVTLPFKKSKKKRNKDKDILLDVNLPELNLSESDSSEDESDEFFASKSASLLTKENSQNINANVETKAKDLECTPEESEIAEGKHNLPLGVVISKDTNEDVIDASQTKQSENDKKETELSDNKMITFTEETHENTENEESSKIDISISKTHLEESKLVDSNVVNETTEKTKNISLTKETKEEATENSNSTNTIKNNQETTENIKIEATSDKIESISETMQSVPEKAKIEDQLIKDTTENVSLKTLTDEHAYSISNVKYTSDKEIENKSETKLDKDSVKIENIEKVKPEDMMKAEDESEKKKSEQQVLEIWDNFKQYQAKVERQKTPPLVTIRKHVCDSDHDYCLIPVETNGDDQFNSERKMKKKRWRKSGSRSASSSSSSSDSSCSCGSNCSCSSSGSSSSSSDSDSSVLEDRVDDKPKRKMAQRRESQVSIDVTAPEDTPVLEPEKRESKIAESDLQTEESETDEDFYDEHPQKLANKMFADKSNRLLMLASVAPSDAPEGGTFGLAEDASQLPPVPGELPVDNNKKRKTKRRKKVKSPKKKSHPSIKLNIPKQKIKPMLNTTTPALAPNKITISLHSNTVQIGNHQEPTTPKMSRIEHPSNDNTRSSKRRRRPNKFYGYTSDDELSTPKAPIRDSFNPYNPPRFEWKKEDLPSPGSSQRIPAQRVPPIIEPTIRLKAPIPDPVPPQILMNSDSPDSSDSDSSDGQLQISQPEPSAPTLQESLMENCDAQPKVQTFSNNEESLYNPETLGNPFPTFTPQTTRSLAAQNPYASHLFRFRRPQCTRPAREGESVYCYCRCPYDEVSEMIGCDAPGCTIEWFHFECVGIMVPPKGKWYCPDCKIRMGMAP